MIGLILLGVDEVMLFNLYLISAHADKVNIICHGVIKSILIIVCLVYFCSFSNSSQLHGASSFGKTLAREAMGIEESCMSLDTSSINLKFYIGFEIANSEELMY